MSTIPPAPTFPNGWQQATRYPDPAIVALDPRFEKDWLKLSCVERLFTGCRWAEGPVYFGDGRYGIEAASRGYFGKHASELTVAEAATLAGLVKSPSRLAPTTRWLSWPNIGAVYGHVAADLTVTALEKAGPNLTLDSFVKAMESVKGYHDIFNGPEVNFAPDKHQGASSSFLAVVKGGRWVRLTDPLTF